MRPSRRSLRSDRGRRVLLLLSKVCLSCSATETRSCVSPVLSLMRGSSLGAGDVSSALRGPFATIRSSFSSLSRNSASCRAICSCLRRSGEVDLGERRNIANHRLAIQKKKASAITPKIISGNVSAMPISTH